MIKLKDIVVKFGDFTALHNINVDVKEGEFFTFLGPSGCGKTTTLRTLTGFIEPTQGSVFVKDQDITHVPIEDRNIGIVFQSYALFPTMTVYDNISFGLEMLKWDKARIRKRVDELLTLLKIEQFEKRFPAELSGGQQQRVAIARTLAPSPRVLFMDEPLSNLDAKLRQEMRAELKRLHSDTNSTFVYVTHDQLEAMTLSTRVCLMETGALQQYDPPLTVYNQPANKFVAGFVGNPTMNFIPAQLSERNGKTLKISMFGKNAVFTAKSDVKDCGTELLLGVRPEFLPIREGGPIEGRVYSTLPTGMETTVQVLSDNIMMTGVVFGSVDFPIDSRVNMDLTGDSLILFDAETGQSVAYGSAEIT